MIDTLVRRLSIRAVPPYVVALTALASYVAQIFAILQGWPLWAIVLATLLPWLPLLAREMAWTYEHYGWLALFYVLVITQGGHVVEHVAQIVQIHVLGIAPREARGIFGALDIEWVHWTWNTFVLVAVILLLLRFRSNAWLWATLVFAAWHELEHLVIIGTYIATGQAGTPGLLSRGGLLLGGLPIRRPELHFLYNVIETTPLVVAFVVEVRRSYDRWLAEALPRAGADLLAELSARCRVAHVRAGARVVEEGEISDAFYVVAKGELDVTRKDEAGGEAALRTLGPGDHFGEIGLLERAARTATVRARTDAELLVIDWRTFREVVLRSAATAEDLARAARQRHAVGVR